jgi:hypothetical protein
MLDNQKSIPLLIGVSILFLIPVGIGGFAFTSLRNDNDSAEKQTGTANSQPEGVTSPELARETNIPRTTMPAAPESRGSEGGVGLEPTEGIPTGTYSNPLTSITTTGTDLPGISRPIDDSDSSVEQNKLSQESLDSSTPDYSAASSSNNFNRSAENYDENYDENSLLTPLEDDSFLEVPESDEEEPSTLSPVSEPLTQPTQP